jgi:hypothetical protein
LKERITIFLAVALSRQNEVKPVLDMIWNAAGSAGSPNYDEEGNAMDAL